MKSRKVDFPKSLFTFCVTGRRRNLEFATSRRNYARCNGISWTTKDIVVFP